MEFLHDERDPVRSVALEHLVGFSVGPQASVFHNDNFRPILDLKVLSMSIGRTTALHAFTILANLCSDLKVRDIIATDDEYLQFLVNSILDVNNRNADLVCILLANVAKHENAKKFFTFDKVQTASNDVFKSPKAIDCLIDVFVKGADKSFNQSANFDYLSFFFADVSRFVEGRKYFVTEQKYDGVVPISKLLVFTEMYDSKVRREGVASTIKNSLFEVEAHVNLLDEDGVNILPYLLLPIATSEDANLDEEELFKLPDELQLLPDDKRREPIEEIICVHLESLLLLCSTKSAREYLRSKSVYPLIRELHKNSNNDKVQEICDRIVQMLMRDEDPNNDKMEEIPTKEELGDIESDEEEAKKIEQRLEEEAEEESSDDDEIVEVV